MPTKGNVASSFSGFAIGVDLTPIPSPLLCDFLAEMDDLNELRLLLRIFWLLHKKPAAERILTTKELAADDTTAKVLGLYGDELAEQIEILVENLYQRKILLLASSKADVCFALNNEAGRQLLQSERFRAFHMATEAEAVPGADLATSSSQKVVDAYVKNIGELSPMVRDHLSELMYSYSEAEILEAIETAAFKNARSVNFISAVLRNNVKKFGENRTRSRQDSTGSEKEYFARRYSD